MAEIAITVLVVLFVFGAFNIPALGDALGRRFRRDAAAPPQDQDGKPLP
ncbi:MAG: twin-arginine translocase TatA/TatE family subunit [Anaeromyxobacter sp.]